MNRQRRERGQSLVIMTVAMLVMLGLGALIVDGGTMYVHRRQAQTAADAAALAGARELCVEHGGSAEINAVVDQFAMTENGATSVDNVSIDFDEARVGVQTTVQTPSFLGRMFGSENDTARAEAEAGCFAPASTTRMLPIAWTCRPPVGGTLIDCQIQAIPWGLFEVLLGTFNFDSGLLDEGNGISLTSYYDGTGGKMTYLIMDSNADFDPLTDCADLPPAGGTITCDFDGDGVSNLEGGQDGRGWLLLDGTDPPGANQLVDWLLGGYPGELAVPQWLAGKTGVANTVFINAHDIQFDVALVPVFNAICEDTTNAGLPSDCHTEYVPGEPINGPSGLNTFYRVVGTAPFVVTCVSKGTPEPCPGKTYAGVDNNVSTIEGYFVDGYVAGEEIGPGGFDLGVYVISLTK
jgi:hypothetical protein